MSNYIPLVTQEEEEETMVVLSSVQLSPVAAPPALKSTKLAPKQLDLWGKPTVAVASKTVEV